MEFNIKKNSTLPQLSVRVYLDGRNDYLRTMSTLTASTVYFSMVDVDTNILKIANKPAEVIAVINDVNGEYEYYINYQFSIRDVIKAGRYEGFFNIDSSNGVVILPLRDKLFINVNESFINVSQNFVTVTPTPTFTPTPTPTPVIQSFLFFSAPSIIGATNDYISHDSSSTTFYINQSAVSFETYLTQRVNNDDRITMYTGNVCVDKDIITYELTYPQKTGQTASSIAAFFVHPIQVGTVVTISDGSGTYTVNPVGGRSSNLQGAFQYQGKSYLLYKWLANQAPNTNINLQITECS
jgi:hypothetical protein